MRLFNLTELMAAMPANGRLLGIDPGAKRIGIALSDVSRRVASPYGLLTRTRLKQNAGEVAAIAAREGAFGMVVGLALTDDQELGRAAQAARDWAYALSAATGLPAALQDESLSTADAHEMLIAAINMSRLKRDRIIDKLAAANILQSALDRHRKGGGA